MKNVWRLIASNPKHDQERTLAWIRQRGRISIGWGNVGDLRMKRYSSAAEIRTAIRELYPHERSFIDGGASLWNLLEMGMGDLVIVNAKGHRELVVEIEGPYEYVTGPPSQIPYRHQRAIRRTDWDPEDLWQKAGGPDTGQSIRWTLIRCKNPV